MADLGAEHSARMHEKGALERPWTVDDWLAHIEEEERLLFPLLEPFFPDQVAMLKAEHSAFLWRFKLYKGFLPADKLFVAHHANLEDQMSARFVETTGYRFKGAVGAVKAPSMPATGVKPPSAVGARFPDKR